MASRPILAPQQVIINGDMSQSTVISLITVIQNASMLSYDVSWSGSSPVGTLQVQASNTYSQNVDGSVANAGTWTSIYLNVNGTPSQTVDVTGNTGSGFIDVDALGAYAVRLVYTKTSGTGTINATFAGKVS